MTRQMLFAVMFLGISAASANRAETPGLLLARLEGVSGGQTGNAQMTMQVALGGSFSAAPVAGAQLEFQAGVRAPASDRAGLLTAARVARQLTAQEPILEPTATDLAGNADGRIDAADVTTLVNKQVP